MQERARALVFGAMGRLRNLVMTRNSYFLAAVVATAFVGDIAADYAIEGAWRWNNKGVA